MVRISLTDENAVEQLSNDNPVEEMQSLVKEVEHELNETNSEIETLRRRIKELESNKTNLKQNLRKGRDSLESLQRKAKIEEEAKRVQAELANAEQRYRDILNRLKFPYDPFPHQISGASKLAVAKRGLCADRRGLGKTLTGILWRHFVGAKKTLYLAPAKLIEQTMRLIEEWDNENGNVAINLMGSSRNERDFMLNYAANKADEVTVVLNYEAWRKDDTLIGQLQLFGFDAMIMDEVHNAKRGSTVVRAGLKRLSERIDCVLELTGTPILNRPQEIWSPLNMLYPDIFPSEAAFLRDYCSGWGSQWYWSPGAQDELARKISAFYIARDRDSVGIKVPPPEIIKYDLSLDNHLNQKEAYITLAQHGIVQLQKEDVRSNMMNVLVELTRQRQMVTWPPAIDFFDEETMKHYTFDVFESVKVDWTQDLLNDLLEEDERVIVFSNFKGPLDELQERLLQKGVAVAKYVGETPKDVRNEIEKDFDLTTAPEDPRWQVMLATYKTVGEGLNLNAARHVILLDREWNPGKEEQAIGRIDRLNSTDQATVHIPHVNDTVDDFIAKLIKHKASVVGGFKEATEVADSLISQLQSDIKENK